ncbi:MAG: Rv3654c family TadE-like protein [Dermatophilaceae bacterium]
MMWRERGGRRGWPAGVGGGAGQRQHCPRERRFGSLSRERGSGTVLASAALAVVVLTAVVALILAAVVRDGRVARVAADLAVLAAAAPLAVGETADCAAAVDVATANGARVESCTPLGDGSVLVAVTAPRGGVGSWLPLPATMRAQARAGLAPPAARSP